MPTPDHEQRDCIRSVGILRMPQERPESPTDTARRHVTDAEARLARQRESVREMQEDGYGRPPAIAARVLVTMEADVSLLREHLQQVEELHP
jgi:hypothetical protein